MSKELYFKAFLPPTIDLPAIWEAISVHENTHLGGENSKYTVMFQGEIAEGLRVLEVILSEVDDYEVSLHTVVKGGEEIVEEVSESPSGQAPSDCL